MITGRVKSKTNNLYKIGVVGMGLIGGSLIKALKLKGKYTDITAVDIDEQALQQAYNEKMISYYSLDIKTLADRDIIFVCVPPGKITSIIKSLYPWYKGLVTDVSSVKTKIYYTIVKDFPDLRYLPVHPMAGSERIGYQASDVSLFENAPFIICTTDSEHKNYNEDDVNILKEIAEMIGSRPIVMDVDYHDRSVGMISHLPHMVAYALVKFIADSENEVLKDIAAGGFRDITRIASSDPDLWADIISESDIIVSELIDGYIDILKELSNKINNKTDLISIFADAKHYRDNMLINAGKKERVQLWVDVDDKPGIIGRIAVVLGDNNINIKNINIQDNREYEGGCMRITLASSDDALIAEKILKNEDLKVRIVC